jgi:hypothetical protein
MFFSIVQVSEHVVTQSVEPEDITFLQEPGPLEEEGGIVFREVGVLNETNEAVFIILSQPEPKAKTSHKYDYDDSFYD